MPARTRMALRKGLERSDSVRGAEIRASSGQSGSSYAGVLLFSLSFSQATYEDECRRGSSNYISSILQPYFNDSFPKSTVAHFCFSAIADFAESLINIQLASPNDMRSGEQLGDEALWQRISEGARAHSERLGT